MEAGVGKNRHPLFLLEAAFNNGLYGLIKDSNTIAVVEKNRLYPLLCCQSDGGKVYPSITVGSGAPGPCAKRKGADAGNPDR